VRVICSETETENARATVTKMMMIARWRNCKIQTESQMKTESGTAATRSGFERGHDVQCGSDAEAAGYLR
jgi:hypothetical protein